MKKHIVALFLFTSLAAFAQPEGRFEDMEAKREKIEAIKVGFITQELDLRVEESQAFWPIYNEMSDKEFALRKSQKETLIGLKDFENASDKEVEKAIMEL